MNEPLITMAPTLSNPEAFSTVDELRRELHRANSELLEVSEHLHGARCALQDVARTLSKLVLAYLAGDGAKVADLLADVIKNNVRVIPTETVGSSSKH